MKKPKPGDRRFGDRLHPFDPDAAERLTGSRELPWTDPRSRWMRPALELEARPRGLGARWGRAPRSRPSP